ncbi:hypothetical protein [Pseudomonas sp.]|uniref:hypothetical protein n=1 Tax=Pseudomonas sp. TaxID=306 RepID=UPI003267F4F9
MTYLTQAVPPSEDTSVKRLAILSIAFSVLAAGLLSTISNQSFVVENGSDRLIQNRVAEGGSDRLIQYRVAEGESDNFAKHRA